MRDAPNLPLWKRVIVAAQLLSFPLWFLPVCLWHGLRVAAPEVPSLFRDGWRLIASRGAR